MTVQEMIEQAGLTAVRKLGLAADDATHPDAKIVADALTAIAREAARQAAREGYHMGFRHNAATIQGETTPTTHECVDRIVAAVMGEEVKHG